MAAPVSSIRNLGPASEAAFARAGIGSAAAVRKLGADAAYATLIETGHPPHFIGYYALVMGLQGRPWNDCRGAEKSALRARFDALVSAHRRTDTGAAIEAELDKLGIGLRRPAASGPGRD